MPRSARIAVALAFLLILLGLPALAQGTVQLDVYYSPTCGHCQIVLEQILPPIVSAYGDRLKMTLVDLSQGEGLSALEAEEVRLDKLNNPLPVLVIGDEIVASEDAFEVGDQLREILLREIGAPHLPGQVATDVSPVETTAQKSETTASGVTPPIHLAYVEKDGCEKCARARVILEAIQGDYPGLFVTTLNDVRDAQLVEAMGVHVGMVEERRLVAPSIYVGDHALVDAEISSTSLRSLLDGYVGAGSAAYWEDLDLAAGESSILGRFQTMGPLAVVLAALVDGINPCAFATILFFLSYLAISGRRRAAQLAVGLAFTAGVFIAYLLAGLGAMSLLKWAATMRLVGLILYGLMAASCFLLAGISIHDYLLARRGRIDEMALSLPDRLRQRIKGRIRAGSRAFAGAAFVTGLIVSLLELACTGQVYLPTISFVVGIPRLRAYAVGYLILYNLVFVIPLLVVLGLTVYGASTVRLNQWLARNTAKTKLLTAILFVLLGMLLLSQVLSL